MCVCLFSPVQFYLRKNVFLWPVLFWQTWHGIGDGSLFGYQCWRRHQLPNREEPLDPATQTHDVMTALRYREQLKLETDRT